MALTGYRTAMVDMVLLVVEAFSSLIYHRDRWVPSFPLSAFIVLLTA